MAYANRPIRPSPGFGALFGLVAGGFYCLFAILVAATRGMRFFEGKGIPLGQLLVSYLGGFLLGGALVGSLLPLARWRVGGVVLGVIGFLPLFAGITLMLEGPVRTWSEEATASTIICTTLIGGGVGLTNWRWMIELFGLKVVKGRGR